MSRKRGSQQQLNPQLAEQLEASEDQGGAASAEGFARASEEKLRHRRRFRVRKNRSSGAGQAAPAPKTNPFANFSGLTGATATGASGAPPPSAPPAFSAAMQPPSGTAGAAATPGGRSTYYNKVKALNTSFRAWVEEQARENPLADWTVGVQEYLDYMKGINAKHGGPHASPSASGTTGAAQQPKLARASDSGLGAASMSASFGSGGAGGASASPGAGFSFGGAGTGGKDEDKAKAGAGSGFSFGTGAGSAGTGASASPGAGFSFGGAGTGGKDEDKAKAGTGSGFSFGTGAGSTNPAPGGDAGVDEDSSKFAKEQDLGPTLEKAKDEDGVTLHYEVRAKLFKLGGGEQPAWKDFGVGELRVKSRDGRAFAQMSNGAGKTVLNTPLYPELAVELKGKKSVAFVTADAGDNAPAHVMLRVASPEAAEELRSKIDQYKGNK